MVSESILHFLKISMKRMLTFFVEHIEDVRLQLCDIFRLKKSCLINKRLSKNTKRNS